MLQVFWNYTIGLCEVYEWIMSQMCVCVRVVLKVVDEVEATRNIVLCFWIYSDRLIKNTMGLTIAVRFTSITACVLVQRGFTSMNKLMWLNSTWVEGTFQNESPPVRADLAFENLWQACRASEGDLQG